MKKPNHGKVGTEEEEWLQSDFRFHRSMSQEEIKARFSSGAAYSEDTLGNALLGCAYSNELRMAESLVDSYRAPIDFVDPPTGLTALHIAVGRDHLELAKYLVKMGAPFLPDNQGRTPTTIAAECEVSDEMCDFIAEAEAKAEGV